MLQVHTFTGVSTTAILHDKSASRICFIMYKNTFLCNVLVAASVLLILWELIHQVYNELRNTGHLILGTFTKGCQNRQAPRPRHGLWGAIDKSWRPTGRRENIGWPCLTPGVRGSTSVTVGSLEERLSPLPPAPSVWRAGSWQVSGVTKGHLCAENCPHHSLACYFIKLSTL